MSIQQVMHEAMKAFAPDLESKGAAIEAAIDAGKAFIVAEEKVRAESVAIDSLRSAAFEVWDLYVGVSTSKLLPKDIAEQLLPLYSQEHVPDPLVICKFFTPDSGWIWYPIEFDGLNTFFGYVVGQDQEIGYFALSDLETGVVNDLKCEQVLP